MKINRIKLVLLVSTILIFSSVGSTFADIGIESVSPDPLFIHVFLVQDLGLTDGGGRNISLFQIKFKSDPSIANQQLYIEARPKGGKPLLSGITDSHAYYPTFSNKIYWNFQILDVLKGDFDIESDIPQKIEKQLINEGMIRQAEFQIYFELQPGDGGGDCSYTMDITIAPSFLNNLYPPDGELVNDQKLHFQWNTNLKNARVAIYDSRGYLKEESDEITGQSYKWRGLGDKLEHFEKYYWRIVGNLKTTHGDVIHPGPISSFVYYRGKIPDLSGIDTDELKRLLIDFGITGLENLTFRRDVSFDGILLQDTDNVKDILDCIKESGIPWTRK